jgi:hypothetical protein
MNNKGNSEALRTTTESKRGWTSRTRFFFQSAEEKCLLTSPFIEPVTPSRPERLWKTKKPVNRSNTGQDEECLDCPYVSRIYLHLPRQGPMMDNRRLNQDHRHLVFSAGLSR